MHRSVREIKGIGAVKAQGLEKNGIFTIYDLLHYFPRVYVDRRLDESTAFSEGKLTTLIVRIENQYPVYGKTQRLIVHAKTLSGESLKLLFFHGVRYFIRLFEKDKLAVVSGKIEFRSGMQMVHPEVEFMDSEDENDLLHVGRIVPIYPSGEALKKLGFDSRGFRRAVSSALALKDLSIKENLPPEVLKVPVNKNDPLLFPRERALREIHFPENQESLRQAKNRIIYEELFLFNALMYEKVKERKSIPRILRHLPEGKASSYVKLLENLPFTLTGEQKGAITSILEKFSGDSAGSILLQGDVGSGKTIVALAVLLHYTDNQIQTAIMAPTEILARQHFRTVTNFMGISPGFRCELITGGISKKEKQLLLDSLKNGDINCLIGTHSMIEDPVVFQNLGLVIIDEQHRFGVNQREALRIKGNNPDLIAMSATPIPRSLCLTEFADLDLVLLKEKPAGRVPIKTLHLTEERRGGLYKSIRNHVKEGRQCYIVYPVIDESKRDLKDATQAFEELKTAMFPEFKVELLHGRMKSDERERIMNEFRENRIQILVTTTVIEVGVDVPNATIMVIEHAERFGISQLHQLRGRVGRGSEESFCILMAENMTQDGRERIDALVKTEDGFYLSEVDLKLRGPGELLGQKQHGISGLRLTDLTAAGDLVKKTFEDARKGYELNEEAKKTIELQFLKEEVVFGG